MTNANSVKKFKLFCFEVDSEFITEPITNFLVASDFIEKGYALYAFGKVDDNKDTTRTSRVKEISFAKGEIHIITQNSDYLVQKDI